MIKTPDFWTNRGLLAVLLLPFAGLWAGATFIRNALAHETKAALPIICIGNLSAGGTGKTPVTSFLYDQLQVRGHKPAILIRGYGGTAKRPLWVDPSLHHANEVGDEALMLGESRDVLVARDRVAGAAMIAANGNHDVILMDDGLQHPYIAKDFAIGVFDGNVGIGNGWLIPAGPLRIGLQSGIKTIHAAIINGNDETGITSKLQPHMPVFAGHLTADQSIIDALDGDPVMGFAGIGRPNRFFTSLKAAGANLVRSLAFADHHPYSEADLVRLQEDAARLGAALVTTKKDWVRLPAEWRERIGFLPVSLDLDAADALVDAIIATIAEKGA
ncbi:MAG: tetraacyldisaccharide 4'-kinase [Candidatus Puniceispirillum sp.]|jgi:tetraacyldisaccharide 4'-kinase